MKTLVRTLLVWLVLLAVPFQGFAVAAMTCAHGMAPATMKATHGHAMGDGQQARPPCHGGTAQASAAVAQDVHASHDADGGDQSHQQTCGNCAACSVGTAMAPASNTAAPAPCPCSCCPAAALGRLAAADPDLPERPPRTALA